MRTSQEFQRAWMGLLTPGLVLIAGCTYRLSMAVSGTVISEAGTPVRDVMISIREDAPGPTEKWTGPDGTFTPRTISFSDRDFNDGNLPSATLWFSKEGFATQRVVVQMPYKPKSYSDVPQVSLTVKLERSRRP